MKSNTYVQEREIPKHRSRKDRKRWCRGKVGVEHTPSWKVWTNLCYILRSEEEKPMIFSCDSCGKHLDYWFPRFAGLDHGPRPEEGSKQSRKLCD